jgi:hypothetical protein
LVEATFKGIGLDHRDANTSLNNSVSFGGEFSHVFNLNNMISNTYKGFLKKKMALVCQISRRSSSRYPKYKRILKFFYFNLWYVAEFG